MGLISPNDSTEILYGTSGDVRNELNSFASPTSVGHYIDEAEIPGASIIRGLERATRKINTYLEVVYSDLMPVTAAASVPKILDDISSDLATYYVWRSNSVRLKKMPDEKYEQYYLENVSEGGPTASKGVLPQIRDRKIQIPEFASSFPSEVQTVRGLGQAPTFDVDDDTRQGVDPRTLDDIDRERS